MTRKGNITRFFPGSNTRHGFYSFYDSVLANLDRVFVLKGGPGTGKSTLVKRIGLVLADRGYDIEYLCCSSDTGSLDGVIVPELKVGIVDGTAPHEGSS
ncbi:Mrp family chromosome partitioning ATPase [Desulfitispora alkaliphila]|uniref:ATPase n=1 Tax=Desulfitispora alkaliphila TaxID=622674 RepID=UPI003D24ADA2